MTYVLTRPPEILSTKTVETRVFSFKNRESKRNDDAFNPPNDGRHRQNMKKKKGPPAYAVSHIFHRDGEVLDIRDVERIVEHDFKYSLIAANSAKYMFVAEYRWSYWWY